MPLLLKLSRLIDSISYLIGKAVMWLILAATLISASNAVIRKAFSVSSNAWLEIQWYLFSAVFLLGGGYAFLCNAHVRIDFISNRLNPRMRNWIDVIGIVTFLFPLCYLMVTLGWPLFARAWVSGEMSSNSGGLIRWPVYAMIPLGFSLLFVQGVSELIKRIAFLKRHGLDTLDHSGPSETELLVKEIEAQEKVRKAKGQP
jgi:TRAP-type mannitol/chloroaromatic compound transport system permease small subunit